MLESEVVMNSDFFIKIVCFSKSNFSESLHIDKMHSIHVAKLYKPFLMKALLIHTVMLQRITLPAWFARLSDNAMPDRCWTNYISCRLRVEDNSNSIDQCHQYPISRSMLSLSYLAINAVTILSTDQRHHYPFSRSTPSLSYLHINAFSILSSDQRHHYPIYRSMPSLSSLAINAFTILSPDQRRYHWRDSHWSCWVLH